MKQSQTAFWRCLYTKGHDAALLTPTDTGWRLRGTAVFRGDQGDVAVDYQVETDEAWLARRGSVEGFSGVRDFRHVIERTSDGWTLDGKPNGLAALTDLDFGFTPATNLQQLKRANLKVGEKAAFSVAWFDIGQQALVDLPQIYERRDESHYWYQSPTVDYEAMLEIDKNGFARVYPDLWQMEDGGNSAG